MVPAQLIAKTLGGSHLLHVRVRSLRDLHALVQQGLPKQVVMTVLKQATHGNEASHYLNKLIPIASYKRRKEVLSLTESERTERLARVVATAQYVLGDLDKAKDFMSAAHPLLGNEKPILLAITELGAREVEELLWKIYFGLPV